MANWKKLAQGAAGAAGGGGALNVEDVFSTYLYTGDDANAQVISNGVDLYNEGGLIWTKSRDAIAHALISSEDYTKKLVSNTTAAYASTGTIVPDSGGNGYTVPYSDDATNLYNYRYASWTFRKAPKFFDVVTYTGNGVQGRTVSHNLGSAPGCIIVKKTSSTGNWPVYHRGMTSALYGMALNTTNDQYDADIYWDSTDPTDTVFTLGNSTDVNQSGASYVAYLFAHNNGDGDFGDGTQDIIKCGSWTGTGSVMDINLGFEPQWIMYKRTDAAGSWEIFDNMRGLVVGGASNSTGQRLEANASSSEGTTSPLPVVPTPTGFRNESSFHYTSGRTFIYIAIRRGPMAVPESATDVFAIATRDATPPAFNSSFDAVDFALYRSSVAGAADWYAATRLTSPYILKTNATDAEINGGTGFVMDYSGGWYGPTQVNSDSYSWMWKRAPNFFDVVCWNTENTSSNRRVTHNLGVAPEMVVFRRRDSTDHWYVYHKDIGTDNYLRLNVTSNLGGFTNCFNTSTDTDWGYNETGFYSYANLPIIGYFFASLAGISKVGSYTGNGTSQTIDCGFSSGARFVLIRGYNSAANNWWIFDSERGIVAGNDPYLPLNENIAQTTSYDPIDPHSSGFTVNDVTGGSLVNYSGRNYIFYAIA